MGNIENRTAEDPKALARELYEQGAEAWQRDERARAMTLYAKSAALDPEGPGAQALRMTRDIMNFYDKNQFNP